MSFQTTTDEHLIRSNLWSSQLKTVLEDELFATRYVDMITDFPDGDTINIPSIGQAEIYNYDENSAVRFTGMDTGNFTFSITDYKASATYITEKLKQDSFYMSRLVSSFVPAQSRAIASAMEAAVLAIGPAGQTQGDNLNAINGGNHRFIGGGTNQVLEVKDFARARYALAKANVPLTNLVAIVDPSVEFELSTLTNLVNVSNNKKWEGIVRDGMSSGIQFLMNVYGFDIYVSQNLATLNTTIDSKTTTAGVANLFFNASPDLLPFIGSVRQPPKVDSRFNMIRQRDEYITTARWGYKLYRPENLVVIATDTDQVV